MSRKRIIQFTTGVCICMLAISFVACGKKEKTISYDKIMHEAAKEGNAYYSIIKLKGQEPILLVTSDIYDEGNEKQATIDCTPYYVDKNEKIKKADEIFSAGTAYPLMADENGIYVMTGHEIDTYQIDQKTKKFTLMSSYIEDFDSDGNAKYTKSIDGEVEKSKESEFNKAMNITAKAIHFSKIK